MNGQLEVPRSSLGFVISMGARASLSVPMNLGYLMIIDNSNSRVRVTTVKL